MGFEDVKMNEKLTSILKSHGISELTEIQSKTFPSAANGHDLIGISQTGSGKTLAFLLPILQQIILSDKPFHTLILCPTRELSTQISDTLSIFEELNIRYALLSGGDDFNKQANALSKKPHIIIGTPGRIAKHIQKTKSFHIERIRKLIFDEADRFFEQDFVEDLDIISKKLTKKNQTLMFTATMTERCKELANLFMRSPKIISVSTVSAILPTLVDTFTFIPEKYKLTVLYNYLKDKKDQSTIVFVGLCTTSQKIGMCLSKAGISCEYLHGKMPQPKRSEIIKRFRNEDFRVLISTDVASRGLDISHVEQVINYDIPDNSDTYTHRVGRTARAGRCGSALSLVTQYDVERFQKIENTLQRKIEMIDYKIYDDHQKIKDIFEEVNINFNQDRTFKR